MINRLFQGAGNLSLLLFRQQRWNLLIWLTGLISASLALASLYPGLYQDEQAKRGFFLTMENPAMVAMLGPGYEIEDYLHSTGALFAHECLLFTAIAAAIMNILLTGNSTRAGEEDGRVEMIQALPVGRLACLSSALLIVFLTNLLLALITGAGLSLFETEGFDRESSFLYGSVLGATGLFFAGCTTLFAQLAETSRGTLSLSFTVLIMAYVIRSLGDVSMEGISLISPLGWMVRTGVFADNHWWPVILAAGFSLLLMLIALLLNAIRDLGAGFLPDRRGKKHASTFLKTPLGLVIRLQRAGILAWGIGIFVLSVSFGSVLEDLETYFSDLEWMQSLTDPSQSLTGPFLSLIIAIMSMIGMIPAIHSVLHLIREERQSRTENLFSRTVSRTHLLVVHLAFALLVGFMMQILIALGIWSAAQASMDESISFQTILLSVLVYLPAEWVVISLALFFAGALPRAAGIIWLYVVYCFVILYFGEFLSFPEWMMKGSVFEHIPKYPAEAVSLAPMVILVLMAAFIALTGWFYYNRRDITG